MSGRASATFPASTIGPAGLPGAEGGDGKRWSVDPTGPVFSDTMELG